MLLAGAIFALLLTAAFGVLLAAIESQKAAGRLALRSQEAITAGTELEKSVVNLDNGLRGYVATGRSRALQPFLTARRDYPRQVRELTRLLDGEGGQQAALRRIEVAIGDYVNLWALPLLSIARDRLPVARSVLGNSTGRDRIDAIRASFDRLFRQARVVAAARVARAEQRSRLAVGLGVAGIALVVAGTIGVALYVRRSLIRPVRRVAGATEAVAAGDLSAHVPESREDELGTLARSFNAMTRSLEHSQRELAQRTTELERSNRDLQDYASVVSHDLQGPLVTIGMYASLLERRLREHDPEQAALAGQVGAVAGRLRLLLRDLLAYSRLGQGEMRFDDVSLDAVLRDALDNLSGPISDRGATVVADHMPVVRGHEQRLGQVMQNLLSNAVKFCDEAPRVEVRAAKVDGQCQVSVVDNGIGFDPEHAEHIFRPFNRLQAPEAYDGSGIGLAICARIVDQHGGRIWADSRPGEGSAFHFTLPLAGAPAGPAGDVERAVQPVASA